ncbi:DUF2334 domain-containing protein [Candidatus Pacearchaeota archaeon]|nr:DUF2334 domain-containing protein [Candidatus Pacearchaeota archaeon]
MRRVIRAAEVIFIIILFFLLLIWTLRVVLPRQVDDVSPGIYCEKEIMEKSRYFSVIPLYKNKSIADNISWCNEILDLNKTLIMHGVYHSYNELLGNMTLDEIEFGKEEFRKCFGYYPEIFEPPQLALSKENAKLLESSGLRIRAEGFNLFHKVYHCSDSGKYSNSFVDRL